MSNSLVLKIISSSINISKQAGVIVRDVMKTETWLLSTKLTDPSLPLITTYDFRSLIVFLYVYKRVGNQ